MTEANSEVSLFYSPLWPLSIALVFVIEKYKIPIKLIEATDMFPDLSSTVYGELPLLLYKEGSKPEQSLAVEEYRAILLWLNEKFPSFNVIPDELTERGKLLEFITDCEQARVTDLVAPLFLDDFYSLSLGACNKKELLKEKRRYKALYQTKDKAFTACVTHYHESLRLLATQTLGETETAFLKGLLSLPEAVPSLKLLLEEKA